MIQRISQLADGLWSRKSGSQACEELLNIGSCKSRTHAVVQIRKSQTACLDRGSIGDVLVPHDSMHKLVLRLSVRCLIHSSESLEHCLPKAHGDYGNSWFALRKGAWLRVVVLVLVVVMAVAVAVAGEVGVVVIVLGMLDHPLPLKTTAERASGRPKTSS